MTRPVLFVLDDDAGVMAALRDDLSRRFSQDFRVLGESSAAAGRGRRRPVPVDQTVASAVGDGATAVRTAHEYLAG
jgi:hypothetical protein